MAQRSKASSMRSLLSAALLASALVAAHAHCPNMCNGHGRCVAVNKCECYGSWTGGDCSQRKCPTGRAWADVAIGTDEAHQTAECSSRGYCNYVTGQCVCMEGYEGLACNRMKCPDRCSAHGQCLSMKQHASRMDKGLQMQPYYTYNAQWDADMIHGCGCDTGYAGWDCTHRICLSGDDPLTASQVDEVQLIRCDLSESVSENTFTLSFRGAVTRPFAPNANPGTIRALLEGLPTVRLVSVTYSDGVTFCNNRAAPSQPASTNAVAITFLSQHGDVPALVMLDATGQLLTGALDNAVEVATDGAGVVVAAASGTHVYSSVTGTKENLPCSGRGTCDAASGECTCYAGFGPSDGLGGSGFFGDCGHVVMPITACPGFPECSGNGVCTGDPEYKCTCNQGWQGGDCSQRMCPLGPAWFDYPSARNVAHGLAECSNKGRCNRERGECECQDLFEGAACERMTCPGTSATGEVCSGHGRCMSMHDLAPYATVNGDATPYTYGADPNNGVTWDAHGVHGCLCDAGFTGYDCSKRLCPFGDDVTLKEADATRRDEIQTLQCQLLSSAQPSQFRLRFREAETDYLSSTATASDIQAALQALSTIDEIQVQFAAGITAACTADTANAITFMFDTENGDVPPIQVIMDDATRGLDATYAQGDGWDSTQLEFTGGDPTTGYTTSYRYVKGPGAMGFHRGGIRTLESVKGTSGNEECSNRGICQRDVGVCKCFHGFGSSDGSRGPGTRDDCGFREPFQYLRGG